LSTISHALRFRCGDVDPPIGPGSWSLPDWLWNHFALLLPVPSPDQRGGRPRRDDRQILAGIFYVLRTGCHWKALPRCFGAPSTVHARFQSWVGAGVFHRAHAAGLHAYDDCHGIEWEWQSADGAMTKAPLGGEKTGPNPTDRGKVGTKRSLLTDGRGQPLSIAVGGANINDHLLLAETLDGIPIPRPTDNSTENICLDKGYDYPTRVPAILAARDYVGHVRTRGEEIVDLKTIPGYRTRRWVVERTHSWLNRFRRLLVRWEKTAANYLALLQFACAWQLFKSAEVSG
jgi:putative transposase